MNVLMLDHDPRKSAVWHCDAHIAPAVQTAIRLLSASWHFNDNAHHDVLPDDPSDDRSTPWITRVITTPTTGKESPPVHPRALCAFETPSSWWELFGQRVLSASHLTHDPLAAWASALGGNYDWLWRHGMALDDEHRRRFGRPAPHSKILWTLEACPYALRETPGVWTEVVLTMPEHLRVVIGGCYDSVASCRRYLALAEAERHSWTRREPPPWINDFEGDVLTE